MSTSNEGFIADPLSDKFALDDLPRYAPWVAERIAAVGTDKVRHFLAKNGHDATQPQLMTVWFAALTRCESRAWTDQGYWTAA